MITDLTKEDAEYIGEMIDEIVPHEVDKNKEDFVLKIENEKLLQDIIVMNFIFCF